MHRTFRQQRGNVLTTGMDRVLIVDDDPELCALVRECLGEEGLLVESVHDGRHGLERSLSGKYDIVVLGWNTVPTITFRNHLTRAN